MRLRAIIFDDNPQIRHLLLLLCDRRGYETLAFSDPGLCPLHALETCPCAAGITCADLILCDLNMPQVQGLDFVEALLAKRCGVRHFALMSGGWSAADIARARRLGCHLFAKPFAIAEIDAWLDRVESQVAPDRGLLQWDTCKWKGQPSAPDRGL